MELLTENLNTTESIEKDRSLPIEEWHIEDMIIKKCQRPKTEISSHKSFTELKLVFPKKTLRPNVYILESPRALCLQVERTVVVFSSHLDEILVHLELEKEILSICFDSTGNFILIVNSMDTLIFDIDGLDLVRIENSTALWSFLGLNMECGEILTKAFIQNDSISPDLSFLILITNLSIYVCQKLSFPEIFQSLRKGEYNIDLEPVIRFGRDPEWKTIHSSLVNEAHHHEIFVLADGGIYIVSYPSNEFTSYDSLLPIKMMPLFGEVVNMVLSSNGKHLCTLTSDLSIITWSTSLLLIEAIEEWPIVSNFNPLILCKSSLNLAMLFYKNHGTRLINTSDDISVIKQIDGEFLITKLSGIKSTIDAAISAPFSNSESVASLDKIAQGTVTLLSRHFPLNNLVLDAANNFTETLIFCLDKGLLQHAKIIIKRHISKLDIFVETIANRMRTRDFSFESKTLEWMIWFSFQAQEHRQCLELIWSWVVRHLQKASDVMTVITMIGCVSHEYRVYQTDYCIESLTQPPRHKSIINLFTGVYKLMQRYPSSWSAQIYLTNPHRALLNLLKNIKQINSLRECIEFIQTEIKPVWQLNMLDLLSNLIIETARQDKLLDSQDQQERCVEALKFIEFTHRGRIFAAIMSHITGTLQPGFRSMLEEILASEDSVITDLVNEEYKLYLARNILSEIGIYSAENVLFKNHLGGIRLLAKQCSIESYEKALHLSVALRCYSRVEITLFFLQSRSTDDPEKIGLAIKSSLSEYELEYIEKQIRVWNSIDLTENIDSEKERVLFLYQTCSLKKLMPKENSTSTKSWIYDFTSNRSELIPNTSIKNGFYERISRRLPCDLWTELRFFLRSDLNQRLMDGCSTEIRSYPFGTKKRCGMVLDEQHLVEYRSKLLFDSNNTETGIRQVMDFCRFLEDNRHFELAINFLLSFFQDFYWNINRLETLKGFIGQILEEFSKLLIKCVCLFHDTVTQLGIFEPINYFAISVTVPSGQLLKGMKIIATDVQNHGNLALYATALQCLILRSATTGIISTWKSLFDEIMHHRISQEIEDILKMKTLFLPRPLKSKLFLKEIIAHDTTSALIVQKELEALKNCPNYPALVKIFGFNSEDRMTFFERLKRICYGYVSNGNTERFMVAVSLLMRFNQIDPCMLKSYLVANSLHLVSGYTQNLDLSPLIPCKQRSFTKDYKNSWSFEPAFWHTSQDFKLLCYLLPSFMNTLLMYKDTFEVDSMVASLRSIAENESFDVNTTAMILAKFLSDFVVHSDVANLTSSILSNMKRIDLEVQFLRNLEIFSRKDPLQSNPSFCIFLKKELQARELQTKLNLAGLHPPKDKISLPKDLIFWLLAHPMESLASSDRRAFIETIANSFQLELKEMVRTCILRTATIADESNGLNEGSLPSTGLRHIENDTQEQIIRRDLITILQKVEREDIDLILESSTWTDLPNIERPMSRILGALFSLRFFEDEFLARIRLYYHVCLNVTDLRYVNINESIFSFMKCDKEAFVKTLLRDHHASLNYLIVIKNISMDYELNNMLIHKILLDRLREACLFESYLDYIDWCLCCFSDEDLPFLRGHIVEFLQEHSKPQQPLALETVSRIMSLFLYTKLTDSAPWTEIDLFLSQNNVHEYYSSIIPNVPR